MGEGSDTKGADMSRIYDITLSCGCMLSADGGGGCIPCCYGENKEQQAICDKAWQEFRESGRQAEFDKEVARLNG